MKTVTITEFRKNLFQLVDEALSTGEPIAIHRKGGRVIVQSVNSATVEDQASRFDRLMARPKPPEYAGLDLSLEALGGGPNNDHWTWNENPDLVK